MEMKARSTVHSYIISRSKYRLLKRDLSEVYHQHGTSSKEWNQQLGHFKTELAALNKKVDTLNMVAPSLKIQMVHYKPELTVKAIVTNTNKIHETSV